MEPVRVTGVTESVTARRSVQTRAAAARSAADAADAVATAVLATLSLGASAALRVQKETAGFFSRLLPSGERCKLGINLYGLGRVSDT